VLLCLTSCLLDFYGAREDNGGRGTDSPGGCHPNRTNGVPTPTTPQGFFTGRMPFLPPNQQRQSTEGKYYINYNYIRHGMQQMKMMLKVENAV